MTALGAVRLVGAPGESPDVAEAVGRDVEIHEIDHLAGIDPVDGPAVLLLSGGLAGEGAGALLQRVSPPVSVVAVDGRGRQLARSAGRLFLAAEELLGERGLLRGLEAAAAHALASFALDEERRRTAAWRTRLGELGTAGAALAGVPDGGGVVSVVLAEALRLTGSDAGRLFLAEEGGGGPACLRLLGVRPALGPSPHDPGLRVPVDERSPVGWAAVNRRTLRIDDVARGAAPASGRFEAPVGGGPGRGATSLLVTPLIHRAGHVVGVLQVGRSAAGAETTTGLPGSPPPYTEVDEVALRALAEQAAIRVTEPGTPGQGTPRP